MKYASVKAARKHADEIDPSCTCLDFLSNWCVCLCEDTIYELFIISLLPNEKLSNASWSEDHLGSQYTSNILVSIFGLKETFDVSVFWILKL